MSDWRWPNPTPPAWMRGPWPVVVRRMLDMSVSALPTLESATLSAILALRVAELEEPWPEWCEQWEAHLKG